MYWMRWRGELLLLRCKKEEDTDTGKVTTAVAMQSLMTTWKPTHTHLRSRHDGPNSRTAFFRAEPSRTGN
jgi:ribulose 1,5-bisphosphate carboxylase large subunit-like protein